MAIIGSMVAIVLHERKRVAEIEQESITIFQTKAISALPIAISPCLLLSGNPS